MTNTNQSPPSTLSPEPPIMTSQIHPDGRPLNKVATTEGEHTPGIMSPMESPLQGVRHLYQNKVTSINQISDLTKTDEEHAVVELDMPNLSTPNLRGPENFHFTENNKPSNPDSATETLSGKSTEIPLNDGVVDMDSEKSAVTSDANKSKPKSQAKDQLVSELEAVSHMLDDEEAHGESGIDLAKDDIKGKLLDIDNSHFHDDSMHKIDLTGILNEDDSSISDEIRNSQKVQGIKLADVSEDTGKDPATTGLKKNNFLHYVTQKAQRRVSAPVNKHKDGLTDEDEKMLHDILEQSELLEKPHILREENKSAKRRHFNPTPSSGVHKTTEKKSTEKQQKCRNGKCNNLKDAPKHKEPVPPTKPPHADSNRVEQEKNTEDTVSSKVNQVSAPTSSIKLKLNDFHPRPVVTVGNRPKKTVLQSFNNTEPNSINSKLQLTHANQSKLPSNNNKKRDRKMGLLFSRGAATNKSIIHPYPAWTEDITRKPYFLECL